MEQRKYKHSSAVEINLLWSSFVLCVILKCSVVQHNTIHCAIVQYNTVKDITAHYITAQHSTLQYILMHYITLQYNIIHYITLQYDIIHCSTSHNCTYFSCECDDSLSDHDGSVAQAVSLVNFFRLILLLSGSWEVICGLRSRLVYTKCRIRIRY